MRQWDVSGSNLPPGSEIRFREPTLWEDYRWQITFVTAVILIQTALISVLLQERKKRNNAELEAQHRMTELAHVNRQATAGELSSSIAHEINKPLGSILTNAETAEVILNSPSPDLSEMKEILADIRRDDLRTNEIIRRMRSFLKRSLLMQERSISTTPSAKYSNSFRRRHSPATLRSRCRHRRMPCASKSNRSNYNMILNLIVNSMDAMAPLPDGRTIIGRTELNGASAVISISDSGPGIPSDKLNEIFDPFLTTKQQGMGAGLSIARTIMQAHKGRIWAENQVGGGAVFRLSLPLSLP
jgi:signal transduction histidine kinase